MASKTAKLLGIFNKVVLIAAILVYLGFASSIVETGEWFGFIPLTSVLLGVLLLFLLVEVALRHFALLRQLAASRDIG